MYGRYNTFRGMSHVAVPHSTTPTQRGVGLCLMGWKWLLLCTVINQSPSRLTRTDRSGDVPRNVVQNKVGVKVTIVSVYIFITTSTLHDMLTEVNFGRNLQQRMSS